MGWPEGRSRACLEAEPPIPTPPGLGNDVSQNRAARASSTQRLRRPHGLHLAMRGCELLERAAAQHEPAVPDCPELDVRATQRRQVERMHALRRRELMHVVEMLPQQGLDIM